MHLHDDRITVSPKEIHRIIGDTIPIIIHNRANILIRILRKNLQSIISVGELFAGNSSLPIYCKRLCIGEFGAVREIKVGLGALVPKIIRRINYFLPGFCNNNIYFYGRTAVFNDFKCNCIPGFSVDYGSGNVLGAVFGG